LVFCGGRKTKGKRNGGCLKGNGRNGGWGRVHGDACAEATVLLLELCDSSLEVGELCLSTIAGVLRCNPVAVGPGLFALLR